MKLMNRPVFIKKGAQRLHSKDYTKREGLAHDSRNDRNSSISRTTTSKAKVTITNIQS